MGNAVFLTILGLLVLVVTMGPALDEGLPLVTNHYTCHACHKLLYENIPDYTAGI